ncbi:chromosome segregation protein SMC, partial [Nocardioides massiliensis]
GRPPLGRAEVQLTIDNSDGALPIEYAEVTISRTMFRNGGSEYAINGQGCRLLDVQELLSDSGIGREMHVIVGQGQLDSILHATPEDRRGFIEEAAGVLKHRKRKEKALRKLDSTDGNLTRLQDLLTEIRRQLKPLGKQAEVARQAAVVQADARDARARLLADDLVTARTALEQEMADESALVARRTEVEQATAAARSKEAELEAALREDLPALSQAQEVWFGLNALRERLRGTAGLAAERVRNAGDASNAGEPTSSRDPDELRAQAARMREREAEIEAEIARHREELEAAVAARHDAEAAHQAEDQRISALQRAAADRREGLARLQGKVNTVKSRAAAAEAEIERLTAARAEAEARAERAQRDFTSLETRIAGLDAGEEGLDAEHEEAAAALAEIEDRLAAVREQVQQAHRDRAALAARKEALELGLQRKDGAAGLLAASDELSGILGSVAALVTVRSGYEAAIAAALGTAADAVVVADLDAAVGALDRLKADDLGRAGILVGSGIGLPTAPADLPSGAVWAMDAVDCGAELRPALARLLGDVVLVDDLSAARGLVRSRPELTAVTREGDVLGALVVTGGSASTPSLLEVQAAVDEATQQLEAAAHTEERLGFEQTRLENERSEAQRRVDVALAQLHESDATLAAVAEELGQHASLVRSARGEADRLAAAITRAEEARDADVAGLEELEQRLAAAQDTDDEDPDTTVREELAEKARGTRQAEMDARLALRTAEERGRALHGRADALERSATEEEAARERARERRERLLREGETARAVVAGTEQVLRFLEFSIERAAEQRTAVERSRAGREQQLREVREDLRDLAREHDKLVDSVHRDEMARAQQRMRIEQLEERALEELGLDPEALVAEYGPDQLVPPVEAPEAPTAEPVAEGEPEGEPDSEGGEPAVPAG